MGISAGTVWHMQESSDGEEAALLLWSQRQEMGARCPESPGEIGKIGKIEGSR